MSERPDRQPVYVGLFVAVGVTILAGGVLTIGDLNDTFTPKLSVSAVFPEVSGLQKGDNVWFSGVKVGVVKRLGLRGTAEVEVELRIDAEATRYIHRDALAKIGSDGLIGSRIVVIYGGTPDAPGLADHDVLLAGSAVSSEDIMATLQANNTNLLAVTSDLKAITGRLVAGDGTAGRLLTDDTLHTRLVATATNLDAASVDAGRGAASLATFSARLNQPGHLPHDLVTDRTSYPALTETVGELRHAGERASDLMDGLATGAAAPGTPLATLVHDQGAGADVKGTLDNLERGSRLLAEDLEALQSNFLFRRYFRRRERAAAKAEAEAEAEGPPPDPVAAGE